MSKLNIYVSPELRAELNLAHLDMSKICQDALWMELQKTKNEKCIVCNKKAKWMITAQGFEPEYSCDTHILSRLPNGKEGDVTATVRLLNPTAPKLAEAQA